MTTVVTPGQKAPWHLWVVGVVALLWNGAGGATIWMAQAGTLPDLEPGEVEYYAAQPTWFVVVTDIALVAAILGAIALLLRKRRAVWMFAVSLAAIVVTNSYELAAGTSRVIGNPAALVVTVIIVVLAILQVAYSRTIERRGVLR